MSSNRRRAIRCIFLAHVWWKLIYAKKDVAAIAHPGKNGKNGKDGKDGKKGKWSTMFHKVFHDVHNAALYKLPSTSSGTDLRYVG
ncbi:hypothetical protein CHX27_01880 [Flavobacterium aurantiibacter]|uniref:Uncharacterized protein n=1 Tax=Flavobacterium aurantiibacter TaxID=2023067 RepID=A0A256A5G4_9FLAO|nr:hypothetical protein CHX27_01880 [Flavobacterium aurantiibacter]